MNHSVLVAVVVSLLSGSAWAQSKSNAARVDFDDQLVQGQVNKGAVHLIERKDSDLGSLVKKRTSYRREILAGTAVAEAKPVQAVGRLTVASVAVPVLPIVKPAELAGKPVETPVAAAAAKSPAPASVPAKAVAKTAPVAAKKPSAPAKKSAAKTQSKTNGGSRVVSSR